jgi:hypothetical protein
MLTLELNEGPGGKLTAKVSAALEPQLLLAVTVMMPGFEPAKTAIVSVLDVPLHPLGNVQV